MTTSGMEENSFLQKRFHKIGIAITAASTASVRQSNEKLILLASIYPELKSDTMVQELIQVYIDNNNQLKKLKNRKLDYELWRWWLCFC